MSESARRPEPIPPPPELDAVADADPAVGAEVRAEIVALHRASAPLSAAGSGLVALLFVAALSPATPGPALAAWAVALVASLALRLRVAWRHGRVPLAHGDDAWLRRYRVGALLHGAVWGLAPLLPVALEAPGVQPMLAMIVGGLAAGAMTLTLFDAGAALAFTLPAVLPFALRLAGAGHAVSLPTLVAGAMVAMLAAMFAIAARRAARDRRALVRARRAEAVRAEGARRAESLLNLIFDHAGEGIAVFDAQHRLVRCNPRFVDYAGIDPARARPGVELVELLDDAAARGAFGDRDHAAAAVARRYAELTSERPVVVQRGLPDGRVFEARSSPVPDGGVIATAADITQQRASETAFAEQQRMLALMLETTEQGFWFIDNELRTTDANPAMCRLLGVPREALLGRTIYEFVDEANATVFRAGAAQRSAGMAGSYEVTLTRADGTRVHCINSATPLFDAAGRKTGSIGMFSDVSAQRAAQAEARRAGELLAQKSRVLESTLQSLSQGVLSLDSEGRANAWNRRFLELMELPEALMQSRPTLREIARAQASAGQFGEQLERLDETGRAGLADFLAGNDTAVALQYLRTRPDGTVIDVRSHFGDDGSFVRTYTDVTAETGAQRSLQAAKDEAERANRAKSEFLSRMSHELRTPMNAILGFAQLLASDPREPLSPVQRDRVEELLRGGHHLLALINDVLDLARIEAGTLPVQLQPVPLADLVDDCLRLVQPVAAERGVGLSGPPLRLPCRVLADPTRLRQVLLNLLSNAIKYNREGGPVEVRCTASGGTVRIAVRDEGPGLAPEQQARLFQAFERLDAGRSAVPGAGIGLALSRWLVELMNGRIGVDSRPGCGSTFWVELQAARDEVARHETTRDEAAPTTAPEPGTPEPPPPRMARTVLYIEDNPVNQVLMEGMLAQRPALRLLLAGLPATGLAMAAQARPHLVLLDIQLPGMDGYEVLRRLREQPATRGTPVVAVSANAMDADIAAARAAGFDDYLTKPLDLRRLLAVVDRFLAVEAVR